ncbi:MAG: Flp pilus assembly complex ATPase component TadA [Lachnospiraceae bacterium]|nr:Flp pilus assembly complex ATPase component TadA [Lachnospiraceae bacterium]
MEAADAIVLMCISAAVLIAGWLLLFANNNGRKETNRMDFDTLLNQIREMLNDYVSYAERHPGFNGKAAENTVRTNKAVVDAIRECCSGSAGAREIVCELIEEYLRTDLALSREKTAEILDETDPVVVFYELLAELRMTHGDYAFCSLWKSCLKRIVGERNCIEGADIIAAERELNLSISDDTRLKVLAELLYIYSTGLGAIDILNWQKGCIEEIQLGLSGVSKNLYDYRDEIAAMTDSEHIRTNKKSKDSVHVVMEGRLYKLEFISFGTEDELIRILRNLVLNTVSPELTKKNPMLVVDTPDGRRVSVSRPPLTDAWVGLIRKFDTVTNICIEDLVKEEEARKIITKILDDGGCIAVTGEMASGKTTLLRAMLLKIGEKNSIRVIEYDSFELNVREYLPNANTLTMRVSDEFTEDRVLSFAKKTTGQVFAVGEICSPQMANLAINVSKHARKVLFTAHYKSTEDMITDFVAARINAGGIGEEKAAYEEVLSTLKYDVHIINNGGERRVAYINEVEKDGNIICLYRT